MTPQEVFLSHASADRDFADRVAEVLRRHGIPVWYSPTNILGAQQWHDEIGAALKRCDWFVVLLSASAVQSFWVKRELSYVLQQRRYVDRITPVLLHPCDYEHSLGPFLRCSLSLSHPSSTKDAAICSAYGESDINTLEKISHSLCASSLFSCLNTARGGGKKDRLPRRPAQPWPWRP